MEILKVLVPIVVAIVGSLASYFRARSKNKTDIKALEETQKSEIMRLEKEQENEIERLEKEQKHELNKIHEEVKGQSNLYQQQAETDLIKDVMGGILKDSPDMNDFIQKALMDEFKKNM